MRPHERWIWTELIGFDSEQPDQGVAEYLETTGFVPDCICLLITSPDFALSHEDWPGEVDLPPDFCSRDGHDHNPQRSRQVWTNRQLRSLIDGLHAREEWIEFYAERWAGFWRKAMAAIHAAGKKAVINSAWGRAPFESLYRYGVDYRRIAEAGVDGIVVETVAAGLSMDPRPEAANPNRHHDFLAMLMLIKARVPDTRLIFLHNVHDTVEEWDAIHHKPTVLEREIYALSNVFITRADGKLAPCANGFLACLGDGIAAEQWSWLRERWELAFSDSPRRALGATLVWSDAAMDAQQADFIANRSWTVHRLVFHLMSRGAPVQTTVNVHDVHAASGAILVINPNLLPPAELESVLAYEGGPIVLIGPEGCCVHGEPECITDDDDASLPGDVMGIVEPYGYWDHMEFRPASEEYLQACADAIVRAAGVFTVTDEAESVGLMVTESSAGALRIAIKNKTPFYARPTIEISQPIDSVAVLTMFPSMLDAPEGNAFSVRVPPDGITVVEVTPATQQPCE